ncbi:MAG: Bug family tripartite tricarboxylate transporter substrate binding protein [Gammaproteobacteria bacterium]
MKMKRGLGLLAAGIALTLSTGAMAVDKIHFLVPGGAGGGWDGTARGTGEALTKSGLLQSASYENRSGGGGGKAIAWLIKNAKRSQGTMMVNSTPIILRSLRGTFPQSWRDLTPIAGIIGDYGAFVVKADSEFETFEQAAQSFLENPINVRIAGGSVVGSMDHLVAAQALQAYGGKPYNLRYVAYDAGGKAMAGLLSGETQMLSTGLGEALDQARAGNVRILCATSTEEVAGVPPCGKDIEFVNWRGFFGAPGLDAATADSYAKLLGDMQKTPEWETVRKRNGWVNIYRPRDQFVTFLEQQENEMRALFKELGIKTVR